MTNNAVNTTMIESNKILEDIIIRLNRTFLIIGSANGLVVLLTTGFIYLFGYFKKSIYRGIDPSKD